MFWTRTRCRRARTLLLIAAGVCVVGAGVGHVGGVGGAWGRVGARLSGGGLVVVTADTPMVWGGEYWRFYAPGGSTETRFGEAGKVIPSSQSWKMTVGWTPGTLINGWVVSVPLWPWATLLGVLGSVAWWGTRRPEQGHECARCGYDLRGIGGTCPECGAGLWLRWAVEIAPAIS